MPSCTASPAPSRSPNAAAAEAVRLPRCQAGRNSPRRAVLRARYLQRAQDRSVPSKNGCIVFAPAGGHSTEIEPAPNPVSEALDEDPPAFGPPLPPVPAGAVVGAAEDDPESGGSTTAPFPFVMLAPATLGPGAALCA